MFRLSISAKTHDELIVKIGDYVESYRRLAAKVKLKENEDAKISNPAQPAFQPELPIPTPEPSKQKRRGRPRKGAETTTQASNEHVATSESDDGVTYDPNSEQETNGTSPVGKTAGKQEQKEDALDEDAINVNDITHDAGENGVAGEAAPVLTREEVLKAFQQVHMKFGVPACRALLVSHGITRMSELKEPNFGAFAKACEKRLGRV